jgi:hypothetical protein
VVRGSIFLYVKVTVIYGNENRKQAYALVKSIELLSDVANDLVMSRMVD